MKRYIAWLLTTGLILSAGLVWAAEDDGKSYLGMFAETSLNVMPGMPKIQLPPGFDISMLPPEARAMMAGGATRRFTVRLWSDGIAPADAYARISAPDGLGQGPTLDLGLYRPKPGQTRDEGEYVMPESQEAQMKKMTIKRYWGSSATVKPGQPKVWTFGDLTPEQQEAMKEEAKKQSERARQAGGGYFYRPNWTTGYWPTDKQPGQITNEANLEGGYTLDTNYTGGASIEVPATVNFLGAFELSSPDLSQKPDLTKAMTFEWKAIPNLLGAHAQIFGMIGQDTIIMWSSSEVEDERVATEQYMQMADVRDAVAKQQFMGPAQQEVTVPAGIFKDCDFVSMTLQGWGTGAARDDTVPLIRVQTRTALTCMLGGKKMAGMGGG